MLSIKVVAENSCEKYFNFWFLWVYKNKIGKLTQQRLMYQLVSNILELVSKELNHLAAILHVYAGSLIFMK